jgi:hypothetical protein
MLKYRFLLRIVYAGRWRGGDGKIPYRGRGEEPGGRGGSLDLLEAPRHAAAPHLADQRAPLLGPRTRVEVLVRSCGEGEGQWESSGGAARRDRERLGRWGSEVGGGPPGPSGLLSFCALFWVRTREWSQVGPPEFYDRYTVVLDFPFFIRKYVVRCGRNFNHS